MEKFWPLHPAYRNLMDALPDTVLFCNSSGLIVACNARSEALLGYTPAELEGLPVEALVPMANRAVHVGHRKTYIANPGARVMSDNRELVAVRKDGSEVPVSIALGPLLNGSDQITVVSIRDTTALTQARANQRRAQERTEQAQRLESLGLLSCGVAHDINNLLAVIHGYADLALCNLLDTEQTRESLFAIEASARRLAQLTDQILTFAGGKPVNKQPVDLPELVRETLDLFSISIPEHIRLHYRSEPDLPPLEADPAQIGQVLTNLLLNAKEAIGENTGEIRLQSGLTRHYDVLRPDTDNCYVTLKVEDTGKGLGDADMQRILEPFYTTKSGGQGLGLSIVHGILKAHGGLLNLASEPGKGCSFTVFLPVAPTACTEMRSRGS